MADGTASPMEMWVYKDQTLEALRASITDAALVQTPGRGRAINRTAANPLDAWLMADIVTPLPITEMLRWADIRPDCLQQMAPRASRPCSASMATLGPGKIGPASPSRGHGPAPRRG
jgi:hypothetical protein